MEPSEFAAQLISRLESLKRKQDTMNSLEEKLQQIEEVCMRWFLLEVMVFFFYNSSLILCALLSGGGKRRRRDHGKCSAALSTPLGAPLRLLRRGPPGHSGRTPVSRPEDPRLPVPRRHPPLTSLQLPRAPAHHAGRLWHQGPGSDGALHFFCLQSRPSGHHPGPRPRQDPRKQTEHKTHPPPLHPPSRQSQDEGAD